MRSIAQARKEKGWSAQEAADHFGIPLGTWKSYESQRFSPRDPRREVIEKVLGPVAWTRIEASMPSQLAQLTPTQLKRLGRAINDRSPSILKSLVGK